MASHILAGEIYIDPSSGSFSGEFPVDIRIESEDLVNVVQIELRYTPDVIEFVRFDDSDGSFPVEAELDQEDGVVFFVRGVVGDGVTGDHRVARAYFRPVAGAEGKAGVSIGKESYMVRSADQENILSRGSEGIYFVSGGGGEASSETETGAERRSSSDRGGESSAVWIVFGIVVLVLLVLGGGVLFWFRIPQKVWPLIQEKIRSW